MAGGIDAWNGLVAEGIYDAGMAYFSRASGAEELISLSFSLEEGNRVFYERIAREAGDEEGAAFFRSLVLAEEKHKETLRNLSSRSAGQDADPPPPEGMEAGSFMEGGIPVAEALSWARGKGTREILELAIAMEANSFDRYIKMGRAVGNGRSREVFRALAEEEQGHLERMTSLLDRLQGRE
jgi:rubrerythrin